MTLPQTLIVKSSDPENVLRTESRERTHSHAGNLPEQVVVLCSWGRVRLKDLAFVSCISDFLRNESCFKQIS